MALTHQSNTQAWLAVNVQVGVRRARPLTAQIPPPTDATQPAEGPRGEF